MSIKIEYKSKKNIARLIVASGATLAGIIMAAMLYPELIWVYVVFGFLSIVTIEYKFKYSWPLDIAFPALAAVTVLYIDHLISMVGKEYFSDIHSIIKYLHENGFMKKELELVIVFALYWVLRTFCVPQKVSAIISTFPLLFLSTVNYYVTAFRGSILIPTDIFAAETAANVVTNYHFPVFVPLTVSVFPFVLIVIAYGHFKITSPKEKWYVREIMCGFLGVATIYFGYLFFTVVMAIMPGYSFNYMGTIYNGYISNFFILWRDSHVRVPANYDDYMSRIEGMDLQPDSEPSERPNILVIMNESYCDGLIYSDLWSDPYDPDPYLDAHTTGTAMSSVFGGMTPNSEFSFLTGLPTAFLPEGTTPYAMYVDNDQFSLAWYLKGMGYDTCAMHPFLPNGWNRDRVYPLLGFDRFLSIDDYSPTEQDYIRDYISDRYAYDYAVDYMEALPSDTPGFVFMVTMQNHGGYEISPHLADHHPALHYAESGEIDEESTTYFALINESDIALQHLFERLAEEEEEYIVVMFGDHQPKTSFPTDLSLGGRGWEIPYIIWSNRTGDFTPSDDLTSINYLSLDLLEYAGMPLNDYYRFIASIRTEVPSINTSGFLMNGEWHSIMEAGDVQPMNAYRSLQYYFLFEE